MFTGLVQGVGRISGRMSEGGDLRLTIDPLFEMKNIERGESIAVNGVCLTVEKTVGNGFLVYVSRETLGRTNLGQLDQGGRVNLERALAFGERLGGHLVSGHVDCLANVVEMVPVAQSLRIVVTFPASYSDEVITRGSIALDGISLTVTGARRGTLSVNAIPETQKDTNLGSWRNGSLLNMETDMIGKYVRRSLGTLLGREQSSGGLDMEFLARNGFL